MNPSLETILPPKCEENTISKNEQMNKRIHDEIVSLDIIFHYEKDGWRFANSLFLLIGCMPQTSKQKDSVHTNERRSYIHELSL